MKPYIVDTIVKLSTERLAQFDLKSELITVKKFPRHVYL